MIPKSIGRSDTIPQELLKLILTKHIDAFKYVDITSMGAIIHDFLK